MNEKKCEKCGVTFGCGSDSAAPCWCVRYKLSEAQLKRLREQYNDCLCEKCLGLLAAQKG